MYIRQHQRPPIKSVKDIEVQVEYRRKSFAGITWYKQIKETTIKEDLLIHIPDPEQFESIIINGNEWVIK